MSASLLASGHPHDHGKIKRMKFAVGLALLSFFVSAAHAQEAADASASKVALAFVEAVNTGQYEQIPDLIAGDAVWVMSGRMPISGTHRGRDAIMQFLGAAGAGLEPGSVRLDVQTIVSDGPFGVLEWQHSSRTRDGAPYSNNYLVIYEARDGQAVAIREYVDSQRVADTFFPGR